LNTSQSLRLGFAGTPGFAVPALDALARSAHTISAVFTKPDGAAGRGRQLQQSPVKKRALDLGFAVLQPMSFRREESTQMLRALALDALIVVAYGLILPPAALAAPRLGCFNIHASLLPRWRGAAPIQRALLAGDGQTGVSIMRMEEQLDTGPVLAQRAIEIGPLETGGSLHDRLSILGAELIGRTLDALARGAVAEVPQSPTGATYAAKISKAEALLDWTEDAAQLLRRIRAFNPAPIAETRLDGAQVRVWEAELARGTAADFAAAAPPATAAPGSVLRAAPEGIDVACGRGELRILRLQLAGRKPLAAAEFLKAQRLSGARFASS
jgi:methionyl-tRNA formyltransferase